MRATDAKKKSYTARMENKIENWVQLPFEREWENENEWENCMEIAGMVQLKMPRFERENWKVWRAK